MKWTDKAKEAADKIVETFKNGELPQTLAQIFITRNDDIPSRLWSWNNQFIQAIHGTADARGFKQWNEVGRKVKKGSKSFCILGPIVVTRKDENEPDKERKAVVGFRAIPVFSIQDTEVFDAELWEKHNEADAESERFLDALPMRNVAEKFGLSVTSYSGKTQGARGWYSRSNRTIALGVENLATWAHELVHAADDRLGNLTEAGQHWRSECVAEFGGAALLLALGYETDADIGGAWEYVEHYAKSIGKDPVDACIKVLNRTCDAVSLILEEAYRDECGKEEYGSTENDTVAELVTA